MHNEINEHALNVKDDYLVVCDESNNPPSVIDDNVMPKVDIWFGLNGQRNCYSPTHEDVQQYASSVPGYIPTNLTNASISNNLSIDDNVFIVNAQAQAFKIPENQAMIFQQDGIKIGELSWDAENGLQFEGQLHASAEQFVIELKRLWSIT